MAIPESIKQKANKIRNEVYGKDVREALASGIEEIGDIADQTRERQDSVEAQFQSVLDETTGKDVISAPEIIAARVGADDTDYPNLKERLDTEYQELSSQLAQKVDKDSIPYTLVNDFGAKGDGVTDDTLAIQQAIDASDGKVSFLKGTYKILGHLTLKSNLIIEGNGAILDFSQRENPANDFSNPLIKASGSQGADYFLTSDANAGTFTVKISDTSNFSEGDLVLVHSQKEWLGDITPAKAGELNIIKSVVDDNTLTLSGGLFEDYTTSDQAAIRKITPIENITIEGLKFIGKGAQPAGNIGDIGLVFIYGKNITVKNCVFEKIDRVSLEFMSCFGFLAQNNYFYLDKSPDNLTTQYACRASNASIYGEIENNVFVNGRHAFNLGHGFTDQYPGIQRNISISNNNILGTYIGGIATHNSCEYISIKDNKINGCGHGIDIRSQHIIVEGNIITYDDDNAPGNPVGIRMINRPKSSVIRNNYINGCRWGIRMYSLDSGFSATEIIIDGNIIVRGFILIEAEESTTLQRAWSITNNKITSIDYHAIHLKGYIMAKISDNQIYDITGQYIRAIRIDGGNYCSVKNNIIHNIQDIAIVLNDGTAGGQSQSASNNYVGWNEIYGLGTITGVADVSSGTNNILENNRVIQK